MIAQLSPTFHVKHLHLFLLNLKSFFSLPFCVDKGEKKQIQIFVFLSTFFYLKDMLVFFSQENKAFYVTFSMLRIN